MHRALPPLHSLHHLSPFFQHQQATCTLRATPLFSPLFNKRQFVFSTMAYTVSLFPPLPYPFTPFSPSLINLVVSVDVKHHVYLLTVVCLQAGIAIYTVGVGLSDKGEMESVASSPRNVFAVSDYRELESNVYSLRSEIKARESRPKATFPNITCGNVNVCRYMRGQKHQVCRYLCGQNHQVCYYVVKNTKFVIM